MQAFSLKELPKSGEALSKQNVPFSIGNSNINLPSSLQDVAAVYQVLTLNLWICCKTELYGLYLANSGEAMLCYPGAPAPGKTK
jgi:hypothetical protein